MGIPVSSYHQMRDRLDMNQRKGVNSATTQPVDGVALESDLHEQILAECRRRLWPCVHSRMDAATTTALGITDFIIYADAGRVFNIECKSKTGKQTTAQKGWQLMLERNGHKYNLCRSLEEFLAIIT